MHQHFEPKGTSVGSARWAASTGLKEQGVADLALVVAKHIPRDDLGLDLGAMPTLNNANMGMHRTLNSKIDEDALPREEAPGCWWADQRSQELERAPCKEQHRCANVLAVGDTPHWFPERARRAPRQ